MTVATLSEWTCDACTQRVTSPYDSGLPAGWMVVEVFRVESKKTTYLLCDSCLCRARRERVLMAVFDTLIDGVQPREAH